MIPAEIGAAIEAHARFTFPEEACGLLAIDSTGMLRMAYCLTNAERSPVRFTVDPEEHHGALRHADRNGWSIDGSFHSHPRSEPIPSSADIAGALDPQWINIIAGPVEPGPIRLTAFRVTGGEVAMVEAAVVSA